MNADDLTRWALRVPIERGDPRAIGADKARLVLVALATYADRDGRAWPGTLTLADDVAGLSRRHVRDALALLEESGALTRDGMVGRANRYRLNCPEVAGHPANRTTPDVAGHPATHVAGDVAGGVAGGVAGHPARNRTEGNQLASRARGIGDKENTMRDPRSEQLARVTSVLELDADADVVGVVDRWALDRPGVRYPHGVIARMSDDEIRAEMRRYRPKPAPRAKCSSCDGLGRGLDADGYPTRHVCPACNGAKYLDSIGRSA